jgi:hypothetical protein
MNIDRARFKGHTGVRLLKALFFETTLEDKSTVVYTLKDRDHTYKGITYPSLFLLYMEEEDLTEYNFATKYLDGWQHWKMLCNCTWFKEYVSLWREELYLKIAARQLNAIKRTAASTAKESFTCQRFLIEKGWLPKNTKGRPTNEEIQKEAKAQVLNQRTLEEDMNRIGLVN